MAWWFDKAIESAVQRGINAALEEHLDKAIECVTIQTVRSRVSGFSRVGFVLRIAVALMDASRPTLSFERAKEIAGEVYRQFRADNEGVKFGTEGFDWDASAAITLAEEYEIQHWEPTQ
jgi:hypothetical protein